METRTRTSLFSPGKQDPSYLLGKIEALYHENKAVHLANEELISDRLQFERRMWGAFSLLVLLIIVLTCALFWFLPLAQWGWL